ncbi:MAG: MBL fold metallo-hydrolase [Acidobacteriota bacterium]
MTSNAPANDPDAFYARLLQAPVAPPTIRASAAVVPWRRDAEGTLRVYWARRAATMAFMGGWWAFPGGGVSRRDVAAETDARAAGRLIGDVAGTPASTVTAPAPALDAAEQAALAPDLAPGVVFAALRELFEETGLLPLAGGDAVDPRSTVVREARRRLLAKEVGFGELLAAHGWTLDAAPLRFAGRWLTPPFAPMRFDNRFALLHWPAERPDPVLLADDDVPGPRGAELDRGAWTTSEDALDAWRRGEVTAAPPILHILRVLGDAGPKNGHRRLLDTSEADLGPLRRIEFRPGVVLLPLRTPTLPPATHTNAVLLGTGDAVLIDPATPLAEEQDRLLAALDAFVAAGRRIRAIWLTHHHPDHVGAVLRVRRHLGVPIQAHADSAAGLAAQGIAIDETLAGDTVVDLGGPDAPFPVRVLHTPGHTRGHLAFLDETHGSLIAGDLASTLSTIVIDPPEGDMSAYLDSLERVVARRPRTLFPAHGPVVLNAVGTLERLHRHRLEREEQILAAHADGHTSVETLVPIVYAGIPEALYPVAARQAEAHLHRLRALGRL